MKMPLFCLHFLKDSFAWYRIVSWQLFVCFFNVFLPTPSIWISHFSVSWLSYFRKKSALIVSWNPCKRCFVLSRFSLHLWLLLVWLQCGWARCPLCLPYFSLQFLDLKVNIFHQSCQDFSHFFPQFFFSWLILFLLTPRLHLHIYQSTWYCPTNIWGPDHFDSELFLFFG